MKITRRELRKIIKEETQQHKLKAIIKESVQHQDRMILEEGIFQDAMGFIKEKGKKAANATKDFLIKFKTEMSETKEGAKILAAMATGKEISKEDLKDSNTEFFERPKFSYSKRSFVIFFLIKLKFKKSYFFIFNFFSIS